MRREKIIEKMNGKMKKMYSKRNGKINELKRTVIYWENFWKSVENWMKECENLQKTD